MNFGTIKNFVTSKTARQLLTVKKHSPQLLFGAGIGGMVTTVVLASKATLKLEEIVSEHEKTLVGMDEMIVKTANRTDGIQSYTPEDAQKDKVLLYARTTHHIIKLYGPALIVGTLSVAALTKSHHIMTQRNAGVMAAYAALEKGFDKYRQRVVDDLGSDKDREYRYGVGEREVVVETETGPVVQRDKVIGDDLAEYSIYARLFDETTSDSWNRTPEYNLIFLRSQQNWANDRLRSKGHLFLNEVYDALGLERTPQGQVTGWVMNADSGDNYVDFGIFDENMRPENFNFFIGGDGGLWLDFNVDGVVWDKI